MRDDHAGVQASRVGRLGVLLGCAGLLRAQSPPQFTVTDLGTLPGFAISQATALSSNGTVVGYSSTSVFNFNGGSATGSSRAWIYSNGVLTPLPDTQTATIPLGVNASGQVVGITGSVDGTNAFSPFWYQNGSYNTPAGFPPDAVPIAISDMGPNVAMTLYPDGLNGLGLEGGIWAGQETVLPNPSGCSAAQTTCLAQVTGISANGQQISGAVEEFVKANFQGYWPVVWNGSSIQTFTNPESESFVSAVNNAGQAVGLALQAGATVGTLFGTGGNLQNLGAKVAPLGINDQGWIVGAEAIGSSGIVTLPAHGPTIPPLLQSFNEGNAAAVLWLNGSLYELNSCSCVANASGWDFAYAFAVNDAGQIAGTGFLNGVQTAFLLTPQPAPSISSVVSAGDFGGFSAAAPGSWIEIYGNNLSATTRSWASSDFNGNNAPTSLDGVKVTIGGQLAFLDYIGASPGQINAQVPSNAGMGMQQLIVTNGYGTSQPYTLMVNSTEPGLLAPGAFKISGNQYVVALHSDGATYVLPPGTISGVTSKPAEPGEVITMYGIGFGPVQPNIPAGQIVGQANQLTSPLQVFFGGVPASQVSYDGLAPGYVGLYQFDVTVPSVPDNDLVPLTFQLGGVPGTQTLFTAVHE